MVFGGPLVLGIVAVATRLPDGESHELDRLLALALYVVTLVVTGVVNVPLNNRLDSTEPVEEARALFERRGSAGTSYARWCAPSRSRVRARSRLSSTRVR